MKSFWSEPFLWIHLAGFATVPLTLQVVWLGLAVGDPLPFYWLELLLLAAVGILPPLWMQWHRPFDIFSLLIVALKPDKLTSQQQKILSLFSNKKQRFIAAIAAILMVGVLWELYQLAPLAALAASFLPQWRILGLAMAGGAFLLSNLFVQVPLSVLGVLSTSEEQFSAREIIPPEKIKQTFTIPGFRVDKILP
jgi:hypothetical protein